MVCDVLTPSIMIYSSLSPYSVNPYNRSPSSTSRSIVRFLRCISPHQGLRDKLPAVDSKFGGGFWSHVLCAPRFCSIVALKIVGYDLCDGINSADFGFIDLPSVSRENSSPDGPILKYLDSGNKIIAVNKLMKNTMSATNSVPDNLL